MSTLTIINRLSETKDWTKLVRFSIANGLNKDALAAAHKIVDMAVSGGNCAPQFLSFVASLSEKSMREWLFPDEDTISHASFDEIATIGLVSLYPSVLLCYKSGDDTKIIC